MKKGDRVRISKLGVERKIGSPDRLGTVTRLTSRTFDSYGYPLVIVNWDGNKPTSTRSYYQGFLEVVDEKNNHNY